jgi:hypothetical protein
MAGTLVITDSVCWLAPGWIFDNVLDRVATILDSTNKSLAELLRSARTTESVGYLDIRNASKSDIVALADATNKALEGAIRDGRNAFHDPRFYSGFLRQFQDLQQMLSSARTDTNTN